jgi:hypothetical protein
MQANMSVTVEFVAVPFVQNELNGGMLFELSLIEQIPPRKIGVIFLKNR